MLNGRVEKHLTNTFSRAGPSDGASEPVSKTVLTRVFNGIYVV